MTFDIKSAAYLNNPYAIFKKLRAEKSVCRIRPYGYWAVLRYQDVEMILKNSALFSSAAIVEEPSFTDPQFLLLSRGLLGTDGIDHTRLRRVLRKAFTPTTILELEPIIRKECVALVNEMVMRPCVDFMQAFATSLPMMVISTLLGIDEERKHDFKCWVDLLLTWRNGAGLSHAVNEAKHMMDYFTQVIVERKNKPRHDLISKLVMASEEQDITYAEVISFIRLILVAGTDTTTSLLANAALSLTHHSQIMKMISENPDMIPQFIEEVLRYDGPTISLSRRVMEDTQIAGVKINKHEIVLPIIASANHDESIFSEPDVFNINRNTRQHLAFGTGTHYCLGSQLARMQARIALEEIFKVIASFKRIDNEPLQYLNSFFFRSIRSLTLEIKRKNRKG